MTSTSWRRRLPNRVAGLTNRQSAVLAVAGAYLLAEVLDALVDWQGWDVVVAVTRGLVVLSMLLLLTTISQRLGRQTVRTQRLEAASSSLSARVDDHAGRLTARHAVLAKQVEAMGKKLSAEPQVDPHAEPAATPVDVARLLAAQAMSASLGDVRAVAELAGRPELVGARRVLVLGCGAETDLATLWADQHDLDVVALGLDEDGHPLPRAGTHVELAEVDAVAVQVTGDRVVPRLVPGGSVWGSPGEGSELWFLGPAPDVDAVVAAFRSTHPEFLFAHRGRSTPGLVLLRKVVASG